MESLIWYLFLQFCIFGEDGRNVDGRLWEKYFWTYLLTVNDSEKLTNFYAKKKKKSETYKLEIFWIPKNNSYSLSLIKKFIILFIITN